MTARTGFREASYSATGSRRDGEQGVIRGSGENPRLSAESWAFQWQRISVSESVSSGDNSVATEAATWAALGKRSLSSWMDENPF